METPEVPLSDRINVEPPIINGMSETEALYVAGISVVVFVILGVLLWYATGFWWFSMVSLLFGPTTTTWTLSKHLAVLKRNRPDAYHAQLMTQKLARWGLRRSPYIQRDGWWSIGRSV